MNQLDLLYGPLFSKYVEKVNILLVGVGGIGCEILKVLQKLQLNSIHILDLDTIEVSNLNRQFLFRKEHKGLSKANVAKQTLTEQNPSLNIISYNQNIKEMGLSFFRQFDLVFTALDNADARSYVNNQCMILNIPILEAGTTGFKGQAMLFKRGDSRCFDCLPRAKEQKTYQVCTIRTLPEKPLHCIIWAKYLFGVLFGQNDEGNLLSDMKNQLISQGLNHQELVSKIFDEIYHDQIKNQMNSDPEKFQNLRPILLNSFEVNDEFVLKHDCKYKTQIPSLQMTVKIFQQSCLELLIIKEQMEFLEFEKDDDLIISFISAASNLRSYIFNIEMQNEFQVKEIAGNIIPAICSTNAMVAAIQVSEAMKYLFNQFSQKIISPQKELYIQNSNSQKILSASVMKPNLNCIICQSIPCLVYLDFQLQTFGDFINDVVEIHYRNDSYIVTKDSVILYEKDECLDDNEIESNNLQKLKKLSSLFSDHDVKILVNSEESNRINKYILINEVGSNQIKIENQVNTNAQVHIDHLMKTNNLEIAEEDNKKQNQNLQDQHGVMIIDDDEEMMIVEEVSLKRKPSINIDTSKNKRIQYNDEIIL